MRTFLFALLILILPPTAFAIPTFEHPLLYPEEVIPCDSRLNGLWLKPDKQGEFIERDIIFEQVGEKLCRVRVLPWKGKPILDGHLGQMEGREEIFGEFYEKRDGRTAPDFKERRFIVSIELLEDDTLVITVLSDDQLYRESETSTLNIPHETSTWTPEHVHVTASTEELRAFMLKRLREDTPESFKTYTRRKAQE